jgi:hypothetical protein
MSTQALRATHLVCGATRIIPIESQNKVKAVRKLESGDLSVTLHSGHTFTISKDDELFQAFVVWTVLLDP